MQTKLVCPRALFPSPDYNSWIGNTVFSPKVTDALPVRRLRLKARRGLFTDVTSQTVLVWLTWSQPLIGIIVNAIVVQMKILTTLEI